MSREAGGTPDGKVVALGRGSFFAVDRRAWAHVTKLGSMNAAIAYLVLARGTQGNMRTTAWSATAIENVTRIPWIMAKKAIDRLIEAKIVERTDGQERKRTKPRYHLTPAHEIQGCEGFPPDPPNLDFGPYEKEVMNELEKSGSDSIVVPKNRIYYANSLVEKGVLERYTSYNRDFRRRPPYDLEAAAEPQWIWLPNSIVDSAAGEAAPIERIRETGNLAAMRLFVDLYGAQSLQDFGGIHWKNVRREFSRHKVGEQGEYTVWGFARSGLTCYTRTPLVAAHFTGKKETGADGKPTERDAGVAIFWGALEKLEILGLIGVVNHLIDADTEEGAIMHPLPTGEQSLAEPGEMAITAAAYKASLAKLADHQMDKGTGLIMVPVRRHVGEVQLVGLFRLRHRARTSATAAWLARAEDWAEVAEFFRLQAEPVRGEVKA